MMLNRLFVVAVSVFLMGSGAVSAADWPQWGGSAQRTMASAEQGLPTRFIPGARLRNHLGFDIGQAKNVLWLARLGTSNYSSPTIAGGRVYVGANDEDLDDPRLKSTRGGMLFCFDEKTGQRLWRLVVPRLEIDRKKVSEDFDDMSLGICSTATIDGDRVYLVTNRCEVLCLDARGMANGNDGVYQDEATFSVAEGAPPIAIGEGDADILWRFDMLRDLPVFPHDASNCSVLIHGDFAWVGTANGVYDGKVVMPTAPTLVVFDKMTGRLVAKDEGRISAGVFHGQWASPTVAVVEGREQIIYGAGDGWCYAFEPLTEMPAAPATVTLKELWKFDCNPAHYRVRDGKPIDYWKLVRGGRAEYEVDGVLEGPSEIIGTPVFYQNRLYVAIGQDPVHGSGRGALTCIDPGGSGDITRDRCVWQYRDIGRSMSTPAVADGLIYIGETEGKLHCVDAATGQVQWVHECGDEVWASALVADGKVYLGTKRGLQVLAAGRELKPLANIRLGLGTPMYAGASAANGVLYVASQRNIWAVKEKGEMP